MSGRRLGWGILGVMALLVVVGCESQSSTVDGASENEPAARPEAQGGQVTELAGPFRVLSVSERERNGRNAVAVRFSMPVDAAAEWQRYLRIQRADGQPMDGGWVLGTAMQTAWFRAIQPATEYVVVVTRDLPGADGARLSRSMSETLKTRHLKAVVTFDDRGTLLPSAYARGLAVTTVNVAAVDVDFHRVHVRNVPTFLRSAAGNARYLQWQADSLADLGELVHSARFDLDPEENTRTERTLPIDGIPALEQPGIYFVVMHAAGTYDRDRQVTHFSVTDLGVEARRYPQALDVRVASLSEGSAIQGVQVVLLDAQGATLAEAATTPEGLASFPNAPPEARVVLAQDGRQVTALPLSQPALDLSAFELGARPQRAQELFVYSPRDLFRPGEKLRLAALLRDGDGELLADIPLRARLRRPDGVIAKEFLWRPQTLGYYDMAYLIPASAPTGRWELDVRLPGGTRRVHPLRVEEFLPERMRVDLDAAVAPNAGAAEAIHQRVRSQYLYGASASGNRVESRIHVNVNRHPIESLNDYFFGREDDAVDGLQFAGPSANLDDEGSVDLVIDSRWSATSSPLGVDVIVSVFESGGRAIVRRQTQSVWPSELLPGIRPAFGDDGPDANESVSFELLLSNARGDLLGGRVEAALVREDRQYFWAFDESRGWHWSFEQTPYAVATKTLDVEAGRSTHVEWPVEWGYYRVEVKDLDSGHVASLRFHAGDNWYARWRASESAGSRPDRVTLTLDQAHYASGDTARLRIQSPHAGEALVLVESDQLLWSGRADITGEAGVLVDIPIAESWKRHDTYVSVTVVRPSGNQRAVTPKRAVGVLHLPLDRSDRTVAPTIQAPDSARPDSEVTVVVDVPALESEAFVTLAAVDVGVLSLTKFDTPSAAEYFFGVRRYGVETRDIYAQVIEAFDAPRASLRFGGGSDTSTPAPLADVPILSFFSGLVPVVDGQATIRLPIADFEGRVRLMALAFDDRNFGAAEAEMTVASPVVAQLSKPRFLAAGDQTSVALDVSNLSGAPVDLELTWQLSGPIEMDAPNTLVALRNGERKTLTYALAPTAMEGRGVIQLTMDGAGERIVKRWAISLRPPWPLTTFRAASNLDLGEMLEVSPDWLPSMVPSSTTGSLTLAARPDLSLRSHLANLLRYPYGCLEQTTSGGWPLLAATTEVQKKFDLRSLTIDERMERVNTAVDGLTAKQLSNGGFGLWDRRSDEEQWLTAYATDFLVSAREAGFGVPKSMLDRALGRLDQYLRTGGLTRRRYSEAPAHYDAAFRAYAGYVLSRLQRAPLGALRSLQGSVLEDSASPLPLVHLALALERMGDGDAAQQLLVRAQQVERKTGYLGEYGSPIRDSALIVALLSKSQLDEGWASQLSFELVDQVSRRNYLSTQERNALFLAGLAIDDAAEDAWTATAELGTNSRSFAGTSTQRAKLSYRDLAAGLTLTNTGSQRLQAVVAATGYTQQSPAPVNEGFAIERHYYDVDGGYLTSRRWPVGKLVLVHLKVRAEQRSPDALVVDLLPGGMEIENQNLDHTIRMDGLRVDGKPLADLVSARRLRHEEFRDDRYVAAMDLQPGSWTHLFYLVRAVSPGKYRNPPSLVEDMYRPALRGIGETNLAIEVVHSP